MLICFLNNFPYSQLLSFIVLRVSLSSLREDTHTHTHNRTHARLHKIQCHAFPLFRHLASTSVFLCDPQGGHRINCTPPNAHTHTHNTHASVSVSVSPILLKKNPSHSTPCTCDLATSTFTHNSTAHTHLFTSQVSAHRSGCWGDWENRKSPGRRDRSCSVTLN